MTTIIKSKSNGINSVSKSKRRRGGIIMIILKIGITVCPLYGMKYLPNSISFELVKETCPCIIHSSTTEDQGCCDFSVKEVCLFIPRW